MIERLTKAERSLLRMRAQGDKIPRLLDDLDDADADNEVLLQQALLMRAENVTLVGENARLRSLLRESLRYVEAFEEVHPSDGVRYCLEIGRKALGAR